MSVVFRELVPRVGHIARLLDVKFQEMLGMRLTEAQVRRLWNLSQQDCADALDPLCESGRLVRDHSGRYLLRRFDD